MATTRRTFVTLVGSAALALAASPVAALERLLRSRAEHPDPRPGIDARNVTAAAHLPPDVLEVFDRVREIPHVVDGIACRCGCETLEDMRSLLSCFEGHGMAQHCLMCQGQADLAFEMTRAGRTLDEIRATVDEQFG